MRSSLVRARTVVVVLIVVLVVALGAAIGLLLAARSGEVSSDDPTAAPSPTAPPVAPLTGELVDAFPERSVLAVKVDNAAAARPQSGLADADVVFEELTEGGVTRFIALFHSRLPDSVGPVRSARFVDADILPAYDPVFAISGAADPVLDALDASGLTVVGEGEGFARADDRAAPHNLFLSPEDVLARADGPAPPREVVWPTSDEPPAGGTPSSELVVSMSDVSVTGWSYDAEAGRYRREQNAVPFTVTGPDRVGAANVVVIGAETEAIPGQDAIGQPLLGTEVVGSGRAVVLRDGQRYDAAWEKSSATQHIALSGSDGDTLPLKPGPTWVLLAPSDRLPAPAAPTPSATTTPGAGVP